MDTNHQSIPELYFAFVKLKNTSTIAAKRYRLYLKEERKRKHSERLAAFDIKH